MLQTPPIIAVVGPTASGKSDLALQLATRLPASWGAPELISADAMQLYRGMDIGTAKTPIDQRRGIPHHQIDVLAVSDQASVAAYQLHARGDLTAIWSRGHGALVAGGSGLYVRALLDDITFPGADPGIRQDLEAEAKTGGLEPLYQRLKEQDPEAARLIHPHNARRIIRALEVIRLTGQPFSASMPRRQFVWPTVMIGLKRDHLDLDQRIDHRAAAMFEQGLLDEVRALIPLGLRLGATASRAIGYAQALAVIDGQISQDEAIEQVALATRQLARRQIKWFRADPRIHWLEAGSQDSIETLTSQALDIIDRLCLHPASVKP